MKKILLLLILCLFSVSYAEWSKEKTESFLEECRRAVDPDNVGKNIKTLQIVTDCSVSVFGIKMTSDTVFKAPDKIKQTVDFDGLQKITIYFNGAKGVSVDSLTGVSELEGDTLNETKLKAQMLNPAIPWYKVFDKISIADELEERDGKKYIAVTGSFAPEKKINPFKFLIDPETKLTVYTFSKATSALGLIESVSKTVEFKKSNGIIVPYRFSQTMLGMETKCVLKTFTINQPCPDNIFEYKSPQRQ